MTSLNNLNYYKRSMNSVQSFDDGMGGTIENGVITCNEFTTDTLTATDLNCTNINSTDINTYSITGTQGTFINLFPSNQYIKSSINYIDSTGSILYYVQKIVSTIMKYIFYSPITSCVFNINGTDALTLTSTTQTMAGTLSIPTINVSSSLSAPTATITTANITTENTQTANITTANITNANITNSLTVPSISTTNGIFQNIQPITASTTSNIYTNSTTAIKVGGSGGVNLATNSARYVDINTNPSTNFVYLDFHSSNNGNPATYDARISSTGGTTSVGQGVMDITASNVLINSSLAFAVNQTGTGTLNFGNASTVNTYFYSSNMWNYVSENKIVINPTSNNYQIKMGTTAGTNTNYINFKSSNTTGNYDTRITSVGGNATNGNGTLNLDATTINLNADVNINTNTFRYVPWTTSYSGSSISTIVSVPTGGTQPSTNSTNTTIKYRYSIIGNTMYINFYLLQSSSGTAGSGYYQYAIPAISTYYLDNTGMQASTNGLTNGTRIGNLSFKHYGNNNALGAVYFIGSGAGARLILQSEYSNATTSYKQQDSTYYHYGTVGTLYVAFEAQIPILP